MKKRQKFSFNKSLLLNQEFDLRRRHKNHVDLNLRKLEEKLEETLIDDAFCILNVQRARTSDYFLHSSKNTTNNTLVTRAYDRNEWETASTIVASSSSWRKPRRFNDGFSLGEEERDRDDHGGGKQGADQTTY